MESAAVRSCPTPESSFFSPFLERSAPDSLLRDLPEQARGSQETPALRGWFAELLRLCRQNEAFTQALAAATGFVPGPGRPVFTTPLVVTPCYRLSLLGIHPQKPIPLHDHPGTWSAQMVISGRVSIHHWDHPHRSMDSSTLPLLESVSSQELDVHGISSVTPSVRNIHGVAAVAGNAVLLSIQYTPCEGARQSWFFPLESPHEEGALLRCHRVGKKTRSEAVR